MEVTLTRYEIEVILNLLVAEKLYDFQRNIEEQTGVTWEKIQKERIV